MKPESEIGSLITILHHFVKYCSAAHTNVGPIELIKWAANPLIMLESEEKWPAIVKLIMTIMAAKETDGRRREKEALE